ncbi:multicopper oxidase domain-containing protein [Desulfosporosinus orientis]|nr:multicopper oxidase domain-containing protein [Desulfosporosinus orientis]
MELSTLNSLPKTYSEKYYRAYIFTVGDITDVPGPTIAVFPGDNIQIRVNNRLAEDTSVHWHGLDIPNSMDGVPEIEPSPRIKPGQYFDYRFKISNPPGTHIYHSIQRGRIAPGVYDIDPLSMDFNFFTMNGRCTVISPII